MSGADPAGVGDPRGGGVSLNENGDFTPRIEWWFISRAGSVAHALVYPHCNTVCGRVVNHVDTRTARQVDARCKRCVAALEAAGS